MHRVDNEKPFNEELNWRVLNQSFQDDLEKLGPAITGAERVVLMPNVLQHQIAGLARWYLAIPDSEKPALLVNLMFFPRWTPWSDQAVRGAEFYLRAVDDFRPWLGERVLLCAENDDIAKYYRELLSAEITLTPTPLEAPTRLERSVGKRPVRVGYLGYAKNEKGFYLLPAALNSCFRRRRDFRALIQIYHHNAEEETIEAERALSHAGYVDIVRGNIEKAFYYALLDTCDIIILPYDPVHYNTRGSGVLTEAVTYGKPVVATKQTWAANAIERGECAGVTCDFDSGSLANALSYLLEQLPSFRESAESRAGAWLAEKGVEVYCDIVERHGLSGAVVSGCRLPADNHTSLAATFPIWPEDAQGPLPQPLSDEPTFGVCWRSDGTTVFNSQRSAVTFMSPADVTVALEFELRADASVSESGEAEIFLNGHSLGAVKYGVATQRVVLAVRPGIVSGCLPCTLQVAVQDGAPPMVVQTVRIVKQHSSHRLNTPLGRLTSEILSRARERRYRSAQA